MATLQLENVSKSYGTVNVIRNVDLDIAEGEFIVFVGPSGCGKSTLLRMVAGLEDITGGAVKIDGEICNEMTPKERGIAMVFQSYALYPHKTVYQNMAFSLKLSRRPKEEIDARIREAARILQMEHLLDRRPSQLSGGQRQRVAIGRAIVRHPKVFLFDEPLSNLDAALRVSMRREIAKLHADLKATMIYVTHDQVEAMTLADRIVVLDAGEVQQVGTPLELYHNPKNLFVAGFIGSPKMNFLPCKVLGADAGTIRVATDAFGEVAVPVALSFKAEPGALATLGVRPENLAIKPKSDGQGAFTVTLVEQLGDETLIEIETSGGVQFVVKTGPMDGMRAGDRIGLSFAPDGAHLFDAQGLAFKRRTS
ncbi:sn-glycerol-3-phosphate ABC transporter ATP-binding protein UgpC [Rhizobium sp. KVB221]|uniref:Sn-glycerol-3-phosphate ABC transporter ATP-binding protein UgpC n=1 Tax=Rhizobium setariae TaxID=2801340 RepID=A0A936YPP4_9HYPH|nr:sn-glycerol-3-phosphate ABC transporter ATP-binding protein UgpC [Rhizobium setariae]MBL0373383.1 sn-glycerol-3-phosphate ABC transporter ATP-binding protein UgpC [Rhizobium setariae]